MCFKVNCNKCGKSSWTGCGKHVASVYANIEEGMHCMCRSWPAVVIATSENKIDQPLPAEEPIATSAVEKTDT